MTNGRAFYLFYFHDLQKKASPYYNTSMAAADLRLMTLCTGLENSYMMVYCMFAKESWGVVIVSTSSAGHDNINRMACVNVRDYGLLLQNLVTYEAVKNVAFVMIYFYMPNYCQVCFRIALSFSSQLAQCC